MTYRWIPQLKKTSKLRVIGLCTGKSPVTTEFPAQRASNAENVSIWWRHHVCQQTYDASCNSLIIQIHIIFLITGMNNLNWGNSYDILFVNHTVNDRLNIHTPMTYNVLSRNKWYQQWAKFNDMTLMFWFVSQATHLSLYIGKFIYKHNSPLWTNFLLIGFVVRKFG